MRIITSSPVLIRDVNIIKALARQRHAGGTLKKCMKIVPPIALASKFYPQNGAANPILVNFAANTLCVLGRKSHFPILMEHESTRKGLLILVPQLSANCVNTSQM